MATKEDYQRQIDSQKGVIEKYKLYIEGIKKEISDRQQQNKIKTQAKSVIQYNKSVIETRRNDIKRYQDLIAGVKRQIAHLQELKKNAPKLNAKA